MNKKIIFSSIALSSILITALFHRQALGLNIVIFELLFLLYLVFDKQIKFNSKNILIYGFVLMTSSVFTIITHSVFSYIMHFLALIVFIGILIYPEAKSLISSIGLSISAIIDSQTKFISELSSKDIKGKKIGNYLWRSRIFVIPLFIIFLFIVIYRNSNPIFDELLINISTFISEKFNLIFKDFDFLIIVTLLIALIISNFIFLRNSKSNIITIDANSTNKLIRIRSKIKRIIKPNALKNEYKSGVFLFIILNFILLILSVIEIKWVWFNFEWEGQYLKDFVHQGTYLLILSIIISLGLVLYYFRGNINFYKKNSLLKYLSYIWLFQNAILIISVAIRNYWYIYYFSLAYKRIGVFIFLLLAIYGLYSVFNKVRNKKSNFYLLKTNALVLFMVLTLSSFVNWDSIIADYNFKNSDRAFLHLDYLSTLSDKTLTTLDKDLSELVEINKVQKEKFMFDVDYMSPVEYNELIDKRKILFIQEWEAKSIFSWNLPEYRTYKALKYSSVNP